VLRDLGLLVTLFLLELRPQPIVFLHDLVGLLVEGLQLVLVPLLHLEVLGVGLLCVPMLLHEVLLKYGGLKREGGMNEW